MRYVFMALALGWNLAHAEEFKFPSEIKRVFVVIFENEDVGPALKKPFFASLAAGGAVLMNDKAITHPSQPNYISLIAGSPMDVRDDDRHDIDGRHLGDLIEAKNKTWKVYAENYPGDCFLGMSSGAYARKHVPFLSFKNLQNDRTRCVSHVVKAEQLDLDIEHGDLPQYGFFVPNDDDNGHDTDVGIADQWLAKRFGPLLKKPEFLDGTLFVITFDEGTYFSANKILTLFYGAGVKPGARSKAPYTHFSLLRTIEDILGVGTLERKDAAAIDITDVWRD